jgi:charged multivesicular body protein 4
MSWFSLFAGKRDTKNATREGIVSLRETLAMLEKKEEHLQKKIDEELRKARANAVSNKPGKSSCLLYF